MKYIARMLFTFALLLASVGCVSQAQPQPSDRPPNIVVFFTDDMGYADLSSYGSTICTTPMP